MDINKAKKVLHIALVIIIILVFSTGIIFVLTQNNFNVITQESSFSSNNSTVEYVTEPMKDVNLSLDWIETISDEFNPNQYYLVDYPNSYPIKSLLPKFLDKNTNAKQLVKYSNRKEGITLELPPTLINVDKSIIKKFINSLGIVDKRDLSNRIYRITNVINKQDFLIIEVAEVLNVPNQNEHEILPTLKYGLYYLGIKSMSEGTIEFTSNKTEGFTNKLKRLSVSTEDLNLKQDFILSN